ncbi:uncharacterized protein LOC136074275 [Hydra vulgaris]|uniref:Uncharacterized protein LOC136074275 n=1 Tax=Hydra vulgaris TaxID=6087 RepID=A0ABM4B1J6_HYDVU
MVAKFFSSNQTNMQFPQTVDNNKNNERKDGNNNTKNEVACQGPSNEIQEVESVESTMHDNELDSDNILREDPALWPLKLKENERMKYLNKRYAFFQNKDSRVSNLRSGCSKTSTDIIRIVAVIRFLVGRGLAFRGHNEVIGSSNNENYLGMLELLTQFNPVLKEIVDSTPDITHVDQLSVVFRYYLNGRVYERFFYFLRIKSHDGKSLITDILDLLERYDIDINNCRGQTYNNASNMSVKSSGLQARLKERSELAFYIPCAGHSLNLRLSDTRWSYRSDASKSLVENFDGINAVLCHIAKDTEEKSDTCHEALCLLNKITKLEFAFMAVLWHHILNAVSNFLQKVELDLHTASSMLPSPIEFVKNLRNDFMKFENESKKLSSFIEKDYSNKNKIKVIKKLSNGENQVDSLSVSDKFRLQPPGFFSPKKDKSETENTLISLYVLNWIVETDIIDVFPNVYIAYRLFLTIPITNCEVLEINKERTVSRNEEVPQVV